MGKRPVALCLATLTAWVLSIACSQPTRYQVLSFFFDGVPQTVRVRDTAGALSGDQTSPAEEPRTTAAPRRYYAHTPYRENRCGGCHDSISGRLTRTLSDGLCLTCHSKLTAGVRFVHGPVAVDDCTVCHHFHTAPFPNLLLVDPVATCLNCHDREDLSEGDHHLAIDQRSCVACHDPHGGSDRFFLKRTEP